MGIKPLVRLALLAGLFIAIGCHRTDGQTSSARYGSAQDGPADPGKESDLKDADAYAARAYDWLCERKYDRALKDYDRAIELNPSRAAFWNARGFTWHMKGIEDTDRPMCEDRALSDYAEAIRLEPNYASAINNRAWLRATSKIDRFRDGKQAVVEAKRACELTGWKNADYLDTLSVAYAEVGDFELAIQWQRKALENPSYKQEEGSNASKKLALYDKQQPFRE